MRIYYDQQKQEIIRKLIPHQWLSQGKYLLWMSFWKFNVLRTNLSKKVTNKRNSIEEEDAKPTPTNSSNTTMTNLTKNRDDTKSQSSSRTSSQISSKIISSRSSIRVSTSQASITDSECEAYEINLDPFILTTDNDD